MLCATLSVSFLRAGTGFPLSLHLTCNNNRCVQQRAQIISLTENQQQHSSLWKLHRFCFLRAQYLIQYQFFTEFCQTRFFRTNRKRACINRSYHMLRIQLSPDKTFTTVSPAQVQWFKIYPLPTSFLRYNYLLTNWLPIFITINALNCFCWIWDFWKGEITTWV